MLPDDAGGALLAAGEGPGFGAFDDAGGGVAAEVAGGGGGAAAACFFS